MKTYQLNKGSIDLPDTWEDLTFKQKLFAFAKLKEVVELKLSPSIFRIELLGYITGYKPQSGTFTWLLHWILYLIRIPFIALYYFIRLGSIRFSGYWSIWRMNNLPVKRDREIINLNLYLLSEKIEFAFRIENRKVIWNRYFYSNPFPYLKINGRKFTGKKFIQDIAPFTNITAKEYSDCYDLYAAYHSTEDVGIREKCMNKIISILYPATHDYKENMVSDHAELISTLCPEIKFGIFYWFSGIVDFYLNHPFYSILFRSDGSGSDSDKISIGMNEIVLMIKKKGYNANDTVNDFFDIQIKILKDDLAEAIAKGAKIEELANKTGLSITDINRLV